MKERLQRRLWIGFALLSPAVPLHGYLAGSWSFILHSYSLGMFFGIVSYVYFANTLILAARLRYFDRLFGHDRVMVFHGRLAGAALVCGFAHAAFKYVYYGLGTAQVTLGILALILFTTVAVATVLFMVVTPLQRVPVFARLRAFFVGRSAFDYSRLKLFHNLTAPAMLLVMIHVLLAAPTAETTGRLVMTGAWGGAGLLFYLYHRVVRALVCRRRALTLEDVTPLTDDIVTLRMTGRDGRRPAHRAGQFGYFRVLSPVCGTEEHPFTISSAPGADRLEIMVKALGDYSRALFDVQSPCRVLFDGPYGLFTPPRAARPCVFVAGGIGITPFLSIIRDWETGVLTEPVALFWTVRRKEDLVDDGLFERMAARHELFTYVPVITRAPGGPSRHIDREMIAGGMGAGALARAAAYICGSDSLRRTVVRILRELHVPRRAIHYEAFTS